MVKMFKAMKIRISVEEASKESSLANNSDTRSLTFSDVYKNTLETEWSENDVDWFCHNWYRDVAGMDLTLLEGISYGQALTGCLKIAVASAVRDHLALTQIKNDATQIVLPANCPQIFGEVARTVFQKVEICKSDNKVSDGASLEERILRDYLSFKIKYIPTVFIRCVREAQKILFPSTRHVDRLVFGDWTNLGIKHDNVNTLWTNHYRNIRSCAFVAEPKNRELERFKSSFPYNEVYGKINLRGVLDRHLTEISATLRLAITNVVLRILDVNTPWIAYYQLQICELFDTYKPSSIELPAELFEPFAVALMIANQRSIAATLMLDGHDSSGLNVPVLRNESKSELRFSRFVVFSQDQANTAKKLGINESMLIRRESLLWRRYGDSENRHKKYGFIIMTVIPNHYNPVANIESPKETLRLALDVALQNTDKRIGIKLKDRRIEEPFVQKVISDLVANDRVDVLVGTFSEHVHKAEFIIGGISTAVAESMMASVPYLIFEPVSNGYSDEFLFNSTTLSTASIARDKASLIQMVQARTNSINSPRDRFLGFSAQ